MAKVQLKSNQFTHKKTLFTQQFRPMEFCMRPGPERSRIRPMIEHGGGRISSCYNEHAIRLAPKDSLVYTEDTFSTEFIINCVAADKLLSIEKYRLPISVKVEREQVINVNKTSHTPKKKNSKNWNTFCYKDDEDILNYIYRVGALNKVKGNTLWKEMESRKVTNHPWQAMRNRLLRRIIYSLEQYDIDDCFKQELALHFGLKCSRNSNNSRATTKSAKQSATNISNMTGEGIYVDDVRNNNHKCSKMSDISVTQRIMSSPPLKQKFSDELNEKTTGKKDSSTKRNKDNDSNEKCSSSENSLPPRQLRCSRRQPPNKRLLYDTQSNSEDSDDNRQKRSKTDVSEKAVKKAEIDIRETRKSKRVSNDKAITGSMKNNMVDNSIGNSSKVNPLKRPRRKLIQNKHMVLNFAEESPQDTVEDVIESKRLCPNFSNTPERSRITRSESLSPLVLHSATVLTQHKCQTLATRPEVNCCNQVQNSEIEDSDQQVIRQWLAINETLKTSSGNCNLRSQHSTASKTQQACHSSSEGTQHSQDADDLVSSYINFEEFLEAKRSFQKTSIKEFMDYLEELSESSEEFEGLHDRKTPVESRSTANSKLLSFPKSGKLRLPSSNILCKDVALQVNLGLDKSNTLTHFTDVSVQTSLCDIRSRSFGHFISVASQTDSHPEWHFPSVKCVKNDFQINSTNLETPFSSTEEYSWVSNTLSKPEYVKCTPEGTTVYFPEELLKKMVAIALSNPNQSSNSANNMVNSLIVCQWLSKCSNVPLQDFIAALHHKDVQE